MKRRDLLKFLLAVPLAEFIDYEKLLWIPGEKKIFIVEKPILTELQIFALELEKLVPGLEKLFEHDNEFYEPIRHARLVGYNRAEPHHELL